MEHCSKPPQALAFAHGSGRPLVGSRSLALVPVPMPAPASAVTPASAQATGLGRLVPQHVPKQASAHADWAAFSCTRVRPHFSHASRPVLKPLWASTKALHMGFLFRGIWANSNSYKSFNFGFNFPQLEKKSSRLHQSLE